MLTAKPEYVFYIADPKGTSRSIHGKHVTEVRCKNVKEYRKNVAINRPNETYETDTCSLNKTLAKHLNGELQNYKQHFLILRLTLTQRGYAQPEEAFMPITSIGVYLQWMDAMICLAVPSKH